MDVQAQFPNRQFHSMDLTLLSTDELRSFATLDELGRIDYKSGIFNKLELSSRRSRDVVLGSRNARVLMSSTR
jgi:hypothetical protein